MHPDEVPPDVVPHWDRLYPGRFGWELKELREAGVIPEIDGEALSRGTLVLTLQWPLGGRKVSLKATYPEAFPQLRPIVSLLGDAAAFPARHCNPLDGTLCLLGRDSRQWVPGLTLRALLQEKLADALNGTGEEDAQGEPPEFYWNLVGVRDSYCLIDSSWELGEAQSGTLRVRHSLTGTSKRPIVKAAVIEVRDASKNAVCRWESSLPQELSAETCPEVTIPWLRVAGPLLPQGAAYGDQIAEIWQKSPHLKKYAATKFGPDLHGIWFALAYDANLAWQRNGLGWLFVFIFGPAQAFKNNHKVQAFSIIRTYRAGTSLDFGARVPSVARLREKRVAVFGVGAIGAPVAADLARNGCRRLHLIDRDVVEPGNGIRWPIGASAWGKEKVDALKGFLSREYPWTETVPHEHAIGSFSGGTPVGTPLIGDDEILETVLGDVDLVVDATASYGVTTLLGDRCRARGVPLIATYASSNVRGGVVARFVPTGGCPVCLEHAWHTGEIEKPRGMDDELGIQPPGCAERTFAGADYDLQELSLQTMRLIVSTLGESVEDTLSLVQTLNLDDRAGRSQMPQWRLDPLPIHLQCGCRQAR